MPTSRNQFPAAHLAKLHPEEAFKIEQAMTPTQRRALFEELEKPAFWRLGSALSARLFAKSLKEAVADDLAQREAQQ